MRAKNANMQDLEDKTVLCFGCFLVGSGGQGDQG